MKIGIPKEVMEGEIRVATTPSMVSTLVRSKHEVTVEAECGVSASFSDSQYQDAGATVLEDPVKLYQNVDIIFKVRPPTGHPKLNCHEAELVREGGNYIGFLAPLTGKEAIEKFREGNRQDLVEKERAELEIIRGYLPEPLSEEEVSRLIDSTVREVGAAGLGDLGTVMKQIMPQVRGRIEGGVVNKLVREKLQNL